MAAVPPPDPTYAPVLSPDLIAMKEVERIDAKGRPYKVRIGLSEAGLEAVAYAGQAHQQFLPALEGEIPQRRGYLVGDGTGVGKGRIVAGVIADNMNQGRKKHVWVSEKWGLLADARRDWADMGGDPNDLIHFDDIRKGKSVPKDGIVFITYDTLKGEPKKDNTDPSKRPNLDVLAEWLGSDFDGVIAFDEAHNMGNAVETEGERGVVAASKKALAGLGIQRAAPNARVLYVSATAATELKNLSYAERLGLWGPETPFASKLDFMNKLANGGVAAMEAVAQSMKAMGSYIARSLSFDDGTKEGKVEYDRVTHRLSDQQKFEYDAMAEAWQTVLSNIEAAVDLTGGGDDPKGSQKAAAVSQFWGAHQRFFNQVITSMQTPRVIEEMKADLAAGRCPVIQLTNTMDAATKRAIAGKKDTEDFEELDISPKEILINYLIKSFPVHLTEERPIEVAEPDKNGRVPTHWVPVKDANGNLVENAEAVAMRDEMIANIKMDLRIPKSPLDMILEEFGADKVAEVTGRQVRIMPTLGEDGQMHDLPHKRDSKKANPVEIGAFQNDEKQILVFSGAGNTGASYHADRSKKNQRPRVHYLLQPGWRADGAVQGFGRTHRTNQKQAPTYRLVEIADLPGQKRFVSTIARRLDQLGALGKGQRQAGSSGIFKAADNLESKEAATAVSRFFDDLQYGQMSDADLHYEDVMKQLGFETENKNGSRKQRKEIEVRQFLNRMLSLKVDMQQKVFEEFSKRLDQAVEAAEANGTLDAGVENWKADKVEKKSETTVYKHPTTGAEVKHTVVTATKKTDKRAWSENSRGEKPLSYVRNRLSGQIYAVWRAGDRTDPSTGQVYAARMLKGPTGKQLRSALEVDGPSVVMRKFDEIRPEEAEKLWQAEYDSAPSTRETEEHFISGALLPIWDRIPGETPRIYRLKTTDGKTMVGRHIPGGLVESLLRNLGHTYESGEAYTPATIHAKLQDNQASAKLANGWKLMPKMVQYERRIELMGPGRFHEKELIAAGVIKEKLGADWHWYIPRGEAGVKTLELLTKARPIVEVQKLGR